MPRIHLNTKGRLASLFLTAYLLGFLVVSVLGQGRFNQYNMEPVVLKACMGRFVVLDLINVKDGGIFVNSLKDFIGLQRQSFDCSSLPSDVPVLEWEPDTYQRELKYVHAHYHVMQTISFLWTIFGVKWQVLNHLYAALFAVAFGFSYLLFRMAVPAVPAFVGVTLFFLNPPMVEVYLRMRDFSKIPFIITALWCLVMLVKEAQPPRKFLMLICAAGIALGIGAGFRIDTIYIAPLFLAGLFSLVKLPSGKGLGFRLWCGIIFVGLLAVCLSPIIYYAPSKSKKAHVLSLGQTDYFAARLDIQPPSYSLGHYYLDEHICTTAKGQGYIKGWDIKDCTGLDYAEAITEMYKNYMLMTPGDQLTRAVSGFIQVLKRNFGPQGERDYFAGRLQGYLPASITLASLVLLACYQFQTAVLAFLTLAYLGGIGSLLYDTRHILHLDFYFAGSLTALVYFLWKGWSNPQALKDVRSKIWNVNAAKMLFVMCGALLLMISGICTARWVQKPLMELYLDSLGAASLRPVNYKIEPSENGVSSIEMQDVFTGDDAARTFEMAYLALDLDAEKCGRSSLHLATFYSGFGWGGDQSLMRVLNFPEGVTKGRLYTPVFRAYPFSPNENIEFSHFALPASEEPCLAKVGVIEDLSVLKLPLHLWVTDGGIQNNKFRFFSGSERPPMLTMAGSGKPDAIPVFQDYDVNHAERTPVFKSAFQTLDAWTQRKGNVLKREKGVEVSLASSFKRRLMLESKPIEVTPGKLYVLETDMDVLQGKVIVNVINGETGKKILDVKDHLYEMFPETVFQANGKSVVIRIIGADRGEALIRSIALSELMAGSR